MSAAVAVEETELRERIHCAAEALRETWTVDELRPLADLLDSIIADRRRIDVVGNVAWLADRR